MKALPLRLRSPLRSGCRAVGWCSLWPGFVLTEVVTLVWYRLGDQRSVTNPSWSIRWPIEAPGYREIALTKDVREMLRYDTAQSSSWQDGEGHACSLIALHWKLANKNSFIGRGHTPDICFTGAGWKLLQEPAPVRLTVHSIEIPFRRYTFEVDGRTAYVFLALWDERSPAGQQDLPLEYGIGRRLKAAWEGKRHQGLKKLEVSIIGPPDPEQSLGVLQRQLDQLIEREPLSSAHPGW